MDHKRAIDLWAEFWNEHFARFEAMNLGTIPPMPPYLLARGVPEPGGMVAVVGLAWLSRRRGRRENRTPRF